jgi:hypothetical protein
MALPVETPTPRVPPAVRGASPRIVTIALGVWLFLSAFLWTHTQAQLTNTWVVGVLCVIFALISMAVPWVRYLNTLLAIWLFISAWALPTASSGTIWNNVLVAIAMFVASLMPSEGGAEERGFFGRPTPPRPI